MKRIIFILLTTILLIAGLTSCIKNTCIQGNGLIKTELRRTGVTGSGNAFTTVTSSLSGILSGSGNIYLRGNPSISQTITGSGRIIKYK